MHRGRMDAEQQERAGAIKHKAPASRIVAGAAGAGLIGDAIADKLGLPGAGREGERSATLQEHAGTESRARSAGSAGGGLAPLRRPAPSAAATRCRYWGH